MAGRSGRNNVSYIKQETPAFIQQFKDKIGYKEPDTIESKLADKEKACEEDEDDRDGEKPVVVLGKGVSQEEADDFMATRLDQDNDSGGDNNDSEEDKTPKDGKFIFKKPKKRKSEESGLNEGKKDKTKQKKSNMKKVKNTSLLSFGDEEEEEG